VSLLVLLGGARSGKSALAIELGRENAGPVSFVATARPDDSEMRTRIARHRDERPSDWQTLEEPLQLAALPALAEPDALVIIDCLTLWIANLLARGDHDATVLEQAQELARLAAGRRGRVIVVSNEVGLGIIPATGLGRRYRDLLGTVNSIFVGRAETALLLVAGRAVRLEPLTAQGLPR
jgi:adenosylcobinamide kinase/adenosylcobinamide-phosphate guanylyltransferase